MAYWEEMYEENNNSINENLKNDCERRIQKIQNFLHNNTARQWSIISVEFGEQLFRDRNFNYHSMDKNYLLQEIKDMKGLNYGNYELCYFHHAIILSNIDTRKIKKLKTLTVIPIQTKYRPNSFKLESKYNKFLEYDSHLLLDSISTIGIERINIEKSLKLSNSNRLTQVNPRDLIEIKNAIKKLYNL